MANANNPSAVKALYDGAFTAVNPSTVFRGYGSRFPQPYDVPWTLRQGVKNSFPVHYPDTTSIAGLPHGVYPIKPAKEPADLNNIPVEDAPLGQVLDPMTVRHQNMPTNANALQPVRGGIIGE